MKARRRPGIQVTAAIVAAAAVALALSSAAAAKPGRFVVPESFELSATLPPSHGYSLAITSYDHRHIQLVATKGSLIATYSVLGRANRNRLDADFGRFGHVSMRFYGRLRKARETVSTCRGKRPQVQVGTLRGRIRFRGTNGFVEVAASRVHAATRHTFREVCKPRHQSRGSNSLGVEEPGPHPHARPAPLARALDRVRLGRKEPPVLNLLFARRQTDMGRLQFGALSVPGFLAVIAVEMSETAGRVGVERSALEITDPAVLKIVKTGDQAQQATVKAPKPFAGLGSYLETPDAKPSWTGSLRVHLPGEARVPLTGPEFHVDVCQARTKTEVKACSKLIR